MTTPAEPHPSGSPRFGSLQPEVLTRADRGAGRVRKTCPHPGVVATEPTVHCDTIPAVSAPPNPGATAAIVTGRSLAAGVLAAAMMALFYVAVVRGASGSWNHLGNQARQDWAYLTVIVTGFGLQITLVAELRHRHRLDTAMTGAGGAGAGASSAGMVACCAHHIADLVPFIGATGAATFLIDYRVPFMVVGIGINAVGVSIAARRLQRLRAQDPDGHARRAGVSP